MVKFHFGNLGCEKGWSQIHSKYGTYQHAHYHFRQLWSITMGTSSENAAGGSRGIAVPKKSTTRTTSAPILFSTIKKRCSHIVFEWMLTSMPFLKTDITLRISVYIGNYAILQDPNGNKVEESVKKKNPKNIFQGWLL